jgi:hypothetical protein
MQAGHTVGAASAYTRNLIRVDEDDVVFLGCDACGLVGRYQYFGGTYRVHLQLWLQCLYQLYQLDYMFVMLINDNDND